MKRRHSLSSVVGYLGQLIALALSYFAAGRLGLAIAPVSTLATLVWPPSGLSLAALVIGGYRLWPGIAAGALATSLSLGAPPLVACGVAAASTLEAALAAFALQRLAGFKGSFERAVEVLALTVAALVSTTVGATAGTVSLALGGLTSAAGFAKTWLTWWVGGVMSDLLVAPLFFAWARAPRGSARPRRLAEIAGLSILLTACSTFHFALRPEALSRVHVVAGGVLFLPLIWAALRFGARGTATAIFVAAVVAVGGTATGHGPFFRAGVFNSLLNLHVTLASGGLGVLVLCAAVTERERALEAVRAGDALLRAVIDGTTDAIFIKDRIGRYVLANAATARVLRESVGAIVGRDDAALFPLDEVRRLRKVDEEVMRTGEPCTKETALTIGGETRVFQTVKVPHRDASGGVLGVIGIARDVTEQKSAELARARLAAIVESSADAIDAQRLDGTITSWNEAAARLYGYPCEEAIGQPISMLVPADERAQLAWLFEQVRLGEQVVNHETVRRCKDARRIEVAVTLSPIRDAGGAIVGVSTIARDATESAERWRLASEAARLGMWCWSMKGNRFAWTRMCRESHGIGLDEEASCERFLASLHPDDRERVTRAVHRSVEDHDDYRVTYRVVWPDQTLHWISVLGRAFYDEGREPARMLGVALDITAQKQAEEERESAARAKDEFLAIVSHELRTPLQSMLGWALMLKARPDDLPTVRKGIDTIERNVKTQARLIEDLLDVSRIVAGKLRLERQRVDLAEVIRGAIDEAMVAADAKSIRIDSELEPIAGEVVGDAQRLQQIFSNLLSNAVKFTPPSGRIRVRLGRTGTRATIAVEDSGCGISPDFLPHVFDRFRQAEEGSTTRRRGGLGLGLAIVHHLVEAHGGTVNVESPGEGRGTTFTVTLPLVSLERRALREERADISRAGSRQVTVLDGVRVLVVDDDPDARELLETVLRREGADVRTVGSARAALEALGSFHADVLLSDIGMPEEDGYALIRELRARERAAEGGHVPAVALTAFASPADRAQALSLGFEAHLAKPASPRDVARTVANMVGRTDAGRCG